MTPLWLVDLKPKEGGNNFVNISMTVPMHLFPQPLCSALGNLMPGGRHVMADGKHRAHSGLGALR